MWSVAVTLKAPRAVVPLAVIGLMLVLVLTGCSSAKAKHDSTTSSVSSTADAVQAATGRALPSGFLGLSMQYKAFEEYAGTSPKSLNPAFLNLIRDIAPNQSPVLRFGGDSTDWSWWPVKGLRKPAGIRYALDSNWLQVAHAMDAALHSRLILGVNLEAGNVRLAKAMANALVHGIGKPSIAGLEIGNEPELYAAFNWYTKQNGTGVPGRNPATWSENAFFKQFHRFAAAMPSGVPLAGPTSGSATYLANLSAFLKGEPRVKLATFHAYPLKHCTKHVVTISQLLSPAATSGFAKAQSRYVSDAHRHGRRVRLDEMNGITCGGYGGVSDSFASALWVLDVLFELDKAGVNGVNMQTVPGGVQEIFGPLAGDGGSMVVHPEFYGMMMFAQAAPAGSRLFTIPTRLPSNVKLWASRAKDGSARVTLINDNLSKPRTVHVPLSPHGGPAAVEALRAPHVGSTSGVTLGGRSFGSSTSTGLLPAPVPRQLKPARGGYTVRIPPATAILLTVPAGAGQSASGASAAG
jgi:hypothetical protein